MKKVLKIIIVIVIVLVVMYLCLKCHYEEHKYDMSKLMQRTGFDAACTLRGVFERRDWSELSLSENFRNKYKKSKDIIPDIVKYTTFGNGYDTFNGKECIIIEANEPEWSFGNEPNSKPYVEYYFNYEVVNGNLLDDVKLVKISYRENMSGREIESKICE